jgi:hypothetical protein
LNPEPNFELMVLGRFAWWRGCDTSRDCRWIAGVKRVNCRERLVRCKVDHAVPTNVKTQAETCSLPDNGVPMPNTVRVESCGEVWFFLDGSDEHYGWLRDNRVVKDPPDDCVSPGCEFDKLWINYDTWRFRRKRIQPTALGDWFLRFFFFTREVLELLALSTLPHRAALLALCPTQHLECVRWNDTRTRILAFWSDSKCFYRTELRVVGATSSLVHACSAKLASSARKDFDWLPEELRSLVEYFRNAGSVLKSAEQHDASCLNASVRPT